ncbi:CCA tRNA nucleotidyltransferase [Sulfurimonas sp.]|uniref:CCA tRNA nucleotidyltransferase n=1 Tax=Sulfurimonas sp. TaxID=2022749 RepID=UPI0025E6E779|nr:CCA tRNA nucleotidyltransferase [Sulfurimonas sp.]MCK9453687.1 CCA tRNA nucleotidyltransferase [Sulfurimonas sp.]
MINYPDKLNIIFKKLSDNGIKPIIVGGFIRDSLVGIESKDIDIEVYGISSFLELQTILKEFGNVNIVGKSFGVCKLYFEDYDLDFSFPRVDNKVKAGHRGFDITIDTTLDFKAASSRRDFTMNSIGYDIIERKILDPFDGLNDFKNRILRAVDLQSFGQDPLRVLRAVGFATRFELKIEKALFSTCRDMVLKGMLEELPKERIFEEIKKLLLYAKKPSRGFELLKEFKSSIYSKNLYVIDEIAKQLTTNTQTNLVLMLSGLCYDFTQNQTQNFIKMLTNEKELLKRSALLVDKHNEIDKIESEGLSNYRLYKLATEVNIGELIILKSAIYLTKNSTKALKSLKEIKKRAKELNILGKQLPAILMGRDLLEFGLKPSPLFSEILNNAYEAQMREEFNDHSSAVVWLENYLNS